MQFAQSWILIKFCGQTFAHCPQAIHFLRLLRQRHVHSWKSRRIYIFLYRLHIRCSHLCIHRLQSRLRGNHRYRQLELPGKEISFNCHDYFFLSYGVLERGRLQRLSPSNLQYASAIAGAVGMDVISPIPIAPQATSRPGLSITIASISGTS